MLAISGPRRPKRSASMPKISAPSGRNISVIVTAASTPGIVMLKSLAMRDTTNVTRKKSNASRHQPRNDAMKARRWIGVSVASGAKSAMTRDIPRRRALVC